MSHQVDRRRTPWRGLVANRPLRSSATWGRLCLACWAVAFGGCRSTESLSRVPGMRWLTKTDTGPMVAANVDPAASLPAPSATAVPQTLSDAAGNTAAHQTVGYESNAAGRAGPAAYPSTGYPQIASANAAMPRPQPNPPPIYGSATAPPPTGSPAQNYVQQGSYAASLPNMAGAHAAASAATPTGPPSATTWNAPPAMSGFAPSTQDTAIQGTVSGPPPTILQAQPAANASEQGFVPSAPTNSMAPPPGWATDTSNGGPTPDYAPFNSMVVPASGSPSSGSAVAPASYTDGQPSHYGQAAVDTGPANAGPWRPGSTSNYGGP